MRPFLPLILLSAITGAIVTGCSVRTERTVYTPAPVAAAPAGYYYYPAPTYYYPPSSTYYREPYHTGYYSSY